MQLFHANFPVFSLYTFSILGRIGGDATLHNHADLALCVRPFSILGRIGGDATQLHLLPSRLRPILSVSSVGSEAMQQPSRQYKTRFRVFLSVSSVGSEAMQRRAGADDGARAPDFQYPRSDRRRCNRQWQQNLRPLLPLSVSSVGSEAMQHCPVRHARHLYHIPFSILGRIGGDATSTWSSIWPARGAFQYPRSDRRRCNARSSAGSALRTSLSVSSVGSEAMQPQRTACERLAQEPFSILGRIGGDATEVLRDETAQTPTFQYPRSDRRRCNLGMRCPL